ncbi:MAG: polymerase, sigma 28 subunit, SigD/FliA/WhiG [Marmoricola sp.]|nr:polymerase, sigma 28 subunit, SigD/FliA/WhiG [Marmoricola sp.]MCW2838233.1 polymerase, sigma 28 subunit, SigD/FliA/WhiG [Marmoricola sp.]
MIDVDTAWQQYAETRDPEARNRLVVQYAPLVKYVVGRLRGRLPEHVDQDDLLSEGILGLVAAVERFDPSRDVQFQTFAIPRIQGAVLDSLRASDWLPRRVRSEVKRLQETRALLESRTGVAPGADELAAAMGSTTQHVAQLESAAVTARLGSLEELDATYERAFALSDADHVDDEAADALVSAIRGLGERDQIILALYYFEQLTLAEIGSVLGVTESRVSQLRSKATQALRGRFTTSR